MEIIISESIRSDEEYNELAVIDELSGQQFWNLAQHYDLEVVADGPGTKSVRDIIDLRNQLVHEPNEFANDPPSPKELIEYINSTMDIINYLRRQELGELK